MASSWFLYIHHLYLFIWPVTNAGNGRSFTMMTLDLWSVLLTDKQTRTNIYAYCLPWDIFLGTRSFPLVMYGPSWYVVKFQLTLKIFFFQLCLLITSADQLLASCGRETKSIWKEWALWHAYSLAYLTWFWLMQPWNFFLPDLFRADPLKDPDLGSSFEFDTSPWRHFQC